MIRLSGTLLAVLLPLSTALSGCAPSGAPAKATLTASLTRAERRLYAGAPPVIPHAPLQIKCVACHTSTGQESQPLGFAPANPHEQTAGMGGTAMCQQCHVFQRQRDEFVASDFQDLPQQFARSDRLYPGAPPVIPHRVFMHENCESCHSGPSARPEIRCSHPLRSNCRQCHVPVVSTVTPELAAATEPPN